MERVVSEFCHTGGGDGWTHWNDGQRRPADGSDWQRMDKGSVPPIASDFACEEGGRGKQLPRPLAVHHR